MKRELLAACLLLAACAPLPQVMDRQAAVRTAGPHRLTNPLLDVEAPLEYGELGALRRKIETIIAFQTTTGTLSHVSVYYRDLNNGPWLGINQSTSFSPASLFKVPIMMALLKQAEDNPALLSTRLVDVDASSGGDVAVKPARKVVAGRSYSVMELIELMATTSDNGAHDLLLDILEPVAFEAMFIELGLTAPSLRSGDSKMKVRDYASFFRILYNSSYLNRKMSETALEILTRAEFNDALVAGVPPGTVVAHKFGERALSSPDSFQLHDCGIVYRPRRPYVLCVMTRGPRIEGLKAVIRSISEAVYAEYPRE